MTSTRYLLLGVLVACGGADELVVDGAGTPDGPGPDADVDGPPADCPTWETCGSTSQVGVIYRDGCAPVACGLMRYVHHDISLFADAVSFGGGDPQFITYSPLGVVPREVRVARYEGVWTDYTVAPVVAPDVSHTAVVSIASAEGPTVWIAWSESDGSIHLAHRRDSLIAPPPWIIDRNVAAGTMPVLTADATQPRLVHVGAGGIHLRRFDGLAWSEPTVIAAPDVTALDASFYNDGFDNLLVAWRTPAQDVRFAHSRNNMPFVVGMLESSPIPNGFGATILSRASSIVYSLDAGTTVTAERLSDGTWQKRRWGRFAGQGRGTAFAAYTSAVGVHGVERLLSGDVAEQVVSTRCTHGTIFGDARSLLVHVCPDQRIYAMTQAGRFPDGWNERCLAVSDTLIDTARSCATGEACVVSGGLRWCGEGEAAADVAYARVCGDGTVDPAMIDGCETAAASVACVPDGSQGTATVPAACAP